MGEPRGVPPKAKAKPSVKAHCKLKRAYKQGKKFFTAPENDIYSPEPPSKGKNRIIFTENSLPS